LSGAGILLQAAAAFLAGAVLVKLLRQKKRGIYSYCWQRPAEAGYFSSRSFILKLSSTGEEN